MKVDLGHPYGEGEREVESREYKIVFWHHQKPPPGYTQDEMGYSELTYNVQDATDVLEVIEWAEEQAVIEDSSYCVYVRPRTDVEDETWLVQIAGVNPTVDPKWTAFRRRLPRDQ